MQIPSPPHYLPSHSWRSSSLSWWWLRYSMALSPLLCLGFVLSWTVSRTGAPITRFWLYRFLGCNMRRFLSLLRHGLCMQMFPADFRCPSCQAPMDAFGDHALLCSSDSRLGGFQLCHSLVQRSLGTILRRAGVYHLVEPPNLRL